MSLIPFGFWGKKEIISSNLIFYYDPAKSSSYQGTGTSVTDLSGNNYTATLIDGTGFSSEDGEGSFTFDGVNDYISVPNGSAEAFIDQSFTIEFWLKPETSPPSQQIFFSITQDDLTQSRLHCRFYSDGMIRFAFFSDDLDTPTGQVSFGSWQYISMRYRSSDDTSTIFKNGTQIAQSNVGPLLSSVGRSVGIGWWSGGFGEYWKGSMGAMYAYQNAQTDAQILSNYNALKSRYGFNNSFTTSGLSLYLNAGNSSSYAGTGTNWNDISPNDNDGTISGATYQSNNGGQFLFDGINDEVIVANNSTLNPTSQITISVWCSNTSVSGFRGLVMKTTNINWDDGYGIFQNNGFLTFFVNSYNGGHVVTVKLDEFTLSNIVGVYDGTNLKLYRNGDIIGVGSSYSVSISNSSGTLQIGDGAGDLFYWGGIISEVSIYNRGINYIEVINNYNATKSRYGL
jgi:hypothetical protein